MNGVEIFSKKIRRVKKISGGPHVLDSVLHTTGRVHGGWCKQSFHGHCRVGRAVGWVERGVVGEDEGIVGGLRFMIIYEKLLAKYSQVPNFWKFLPLRSSI